MGDGQSATQSSGGRASERGAHGAGLPHVSVADRGHRNDGPPERVRDRSKVGVGPFFVSEIYGT